jgi:proline dehydrogenase
MELLKKGIVKFVSLLPESLVFLVAQRYIAGKKLEDAVKVTKQLNAKGILTTIDVLGEGIKNKEEALAAQQEILRVFDAIEENKLNGNVSIKPTQMGLMIDKDFAFQLVSEILDKAKSYNNFVRIDMEDSSTTDATIELYTRLREKYDNVGMVIQAYLKRSYDDVVKLNPLGTNYRLCKGIYIEPEEIAFKDREEIRRNFLKILERMFDDGNYVGIATHDEYLINKAYEMIKNKNIPKDKFEFQMLYGVTEHLRDKINADGYKIRIYVPYGEQWYAYSVRRMQENPHIAWYVTKSLFGLK